MMKPQVTLETENSFQYLDSQINEFQTLPQVDTQYSANVSLQDVSASTTLNNSHEEKKYEVEIETLPTLNDLTVNKEELKDNDKIISSNKENVLKNKEMKISKRFLKEKLKDRNFMRWVDKVEEVLCEMSKNVSS